MPESRTLTLIVTITGDSDAALVKAEQRIHDGLKWLHPAVEYQVVPMVSDAPTPAPDPVEVAQMRGAEVATLAAADETPEAPKPRTRGRSAG